MRNFITSLYITVIILSGCQQRSQLLITDQGNSGYTIIIPMEADSNEHKAARELQQYIEKISGADLPVKMENEQSVEKGIYIGSTTESNEYNLTDHQILIKIENDNLVITGGDSKSTVYAVYTFLEDYLGCRFYTPNAEKIPSNMNIKVDLNLHHSYTPPITTRTVHSRLYYDNHDFADKRKVTYEAFPKYVPVARVHTFHRFIPEEIFYGSHPEYYALRDGRRLPTQLCLTNPNVYKIVRDSVESLLIQFPDAGVISVSQDDNTQHCQCENCAAIDKREGSPSGSLIEFVNRIAREFPDKQISTLAYQYTRKAPAKIRPEPNVLITLCSIECDRSAPIKDKCQDFAIDLEAWGKLTDNIRIWDYTTQFSNFLAPFPNLHTLKPNIRLFRDNNAKWVFEQHSHHPSELFELRSYLTARLLWNPKLNGDSIVHDFFTGYYEEAGSYIENYVHTIHEELKKDPDFFLFLYGDPSQAFESFLKPNLLNIYDSWYDQAEEAVADKPEILKRVKVARLSVDYAILEASRKKLTDDFSLVEIDAGGNKKVPEKLEKRLARFYETCKGAEIILMNETRFTVEEYIDSYRKALARAQLPNYAVGKKVRLLQPPKKYANEDPQVLTDGATGGSSFFANWLGFEGNDFEAIVDLEDPVRLEEISTTFLQVTNHVVFFPVNVSYYFSNDGRNYMNLGTVSNKRPLTKKSKTNDIQEFKINFYPKDIRYIKIVGENMGTPPVWHHAAGTPSWIFADEIEVR